MMEDKDIKILHEQLKLITKNYKWGIKYLGDGDQAGGDIIWYYGLQSEKNLIERYDEYNTFLEDKNIKNPELQRLLEELKMEYNSERENLKKQFKKRVDALRKEYAKKTK